MVQPCRAFSSQFAASPNWRSSSDSYAAKYELYSTCIFLFFFVCVCVFSMNTGASPNWCEVVALREEKEGLCVRFSLRLRIICLNWSPLHRLDLHIAKGNHPHFFFCGSFYCRLADTVIISRRVLGRSVQAAVHALTSFIGSPTLTLHCVNPAQKKCAIKVHWAASVDVTDVI